MVLIAIRKLITYNLTLLEKGYENDVLSFWLFEYKAMKESMKYHHMRLVTVVWWSHLHGHSDLLYQSEYLFSWHERLQFLLSNLKMNFLAPGEDDADCIIWDYFTQFEHSKRGKNSIKERELPKHF